MLLHCLKAEFKFTTPGTSPEVRHSHGSWDGDKSRVTLPLCSPFPLQDRRGRLNTCGHVEWARGAHGKQWAWQASEWPPRRGQGTLEAPCVAWPEEFTTRTRSCWRWAQELA